MKNLFIPYEQASELKELGFDEPCLSFILIKDNLKKLRPFLLHGDFDAIEMCRNSNQGNLGVLTVPLYQQAFDWFRDKHNLYPSFNRWRQSSVNSTPLVFPKLYEVFIIDDNTDIAITVGDFNTYDELQLACVDKLIKIVKDAK